jgi:hypothetical protein
METPKTEPHVTVSQCRNPSDDLQGPHIPLSYYYFGAPDSDSADDTYDPTHKCFNIDVESTSELEDEEPIEGRYTPPHVELSVERDDPQFLADQGAQLEQIHELQDRLDEERENLDLLQQTLEREHAEHALGGRARERARNVNRRIDEDRVVDPPGFRSSQLERRRRRHAPPQHARAVKPGCPSGSG